MDEKKKTWKEIRYEVLDWIHALAVFAFVVLAFVGCFRVTECDNRITEDDIQVAKQEGYDEGYENGMNAMAEYAAGLIASAEEEKGVQEIQDEIFSRYGVTPWEAWSIIDEYNYDWTHGGFTWEEYQNALEAVYDTAGCFPQTE